MAGVTLQKVSKTFRDRWGIVRAVDELTLDAGDGEFLVVVGPSGCGKSTTLRLVAGLEAPSAGVIRIGDRDVTRMAPKDRDVAMVFQSYALYPHMTVYQNMAFGLRMRKTPRSQLDRRIRETAELLGLTGLLDRRPGRLSGGEQQRVALGRAIARRPKVFLFDEPLSNLDAKLRLDLRAEIKGLHRRLGTTVLYVTHDQQEAMALGDRLIVMRAGRGRQTGTPQEVYDRPDDRFVAAFIGAPTINLIPGRVEIDGDEVVFDGPFGRWGLPEAYRILLAERSERAVEVGVRAEDVALCEEQLEGTSGFLRARVSLVETFGGCRWIHVEAKDGTRMVLRLDGGARALPGQSVAILVDLSRAHFFAGDASGQRLETANPLR